MTSRDLVLQQFSVCDFTNFRRGGGKGGRGIIEALNIIINPKYIIKPTIRVKDKCMHQKGR
jgi:hypothetical protein